MNVRISESERVRQAVGAIVEYGGTFLLVHKVKAMDTTGGPTEIEGQWAFPGGGLKPGENVEDALRRELAEETGIRTYSPGRELPPFDFEFDTSYRRASGFVRQHTRMFFVRCLRQDEVAVNDEEIDCARFFTRAEVLTALPFVSSRDYFRSLNDTGLLD